MDNHQLHQPDFGTGQKKLSIYLVGFVICCVLTVLAFWAVMTNQFTRNATFGIIFSAALIQFFVQVICFLRLNTETEQGRMNVMSFVFAGVILLTIVAGSVWIMLNLDYYAMH